MSRYTIEGETLTGIADAVRSITGGETLLTPAQIEAEIEGTAATMQDDIGNLKTAITSKLDSPSTAGTSGQVLTSDGQGGQTWEDPTGAVEDVQINGTSVINDGVANIPVASSGSLGVVRADNYYGVDVVPSGSDANLLRVRRAETSHIKAGTNAYKPIVPVNQHESVFYGLTKAAGVDMASSSNAVGTYTEEAKVAIQKMLGIYEAPWELIREDTFTNETEDDHFITVDSNGEPFELTDIAIMFETPTQQIDSAKGQYGQIWFYYANSNYYASESGAWTQAAGTPSHGFSAILEQKGRLMVLSFSNNTTSSNRGAVNFRYGVGMKSSSQSVQYLDEQRIFTKVAIPKVTGTGYYILCGKRKWN